jgi:hAT family C-terminal dimerisation region
MSNYLKNRYGIARNDIETKHSMILYENTTQNEMKILHDTTQVQHFVILASSKSMFLNFSIHVILFIILVSIVPFETYFSATNRVLTDKRMRLDGKIFQALILLNDWDDVENKLQD